MKDITMTHLNVIPHIIDGTLKMSNEIQFYTSILAMESMFKDRYALSITRTWDRAYMLCVYDFTKCKTFEEDPVIIQQRSSFCFLEKQKDLEYELNRFWGRLVKENVIKDEFLRINP